MSARDELGATLNDLGIQAAVELFSPHRYRAVLDEISSQFTTLGQRASTTRWWWEHLKQPAVSILPYDPVETLRLLIPPDERIWFLAEDWTHTKKVGHFWLYESTIEPISRLLNASRLFEFYLVSKKYTWLVCVNHHDYLIASGQIMVERLQAIPR